MAQREFFGDLIRVIAICAVVLGHWTVLAITDTDEGIDGVNALGDLDWMHPLTWIFQVVPLFFFVGGLANAVSFDRHKDLCGDALGWVGRRFRRLLVPASALVGVLVLAALTAGIAGADPDQVGTAAWVATVPLWFLAAYLAVVALVPLTLPAHRRWGWAVPGLLLALVAGVDALRLGFGESWITEANYLLVWLLVHQLGYAWGDGRLPARPGVGWPIAAAAISVLVLVTVVGPYPVSMVNVPGAELQNAEPPTLALVSLAIAQVGVALALRDRGTRWLQRPGPRWVMERIGPVVLTVFLWHMAAAILVAVVLYGTGVLPTVPVESGEWLLLRLPWLAGCALALAGLVAVFRPLEQSRLVGERGTCSPWPRPAITTVAGVVGALVGMLGIALAGPGDHGPVALPADPVALFALGVALLVLSGTEGGAASRPS